VPVFLRYSRHYIEEKMAISTTTLVDDFTARCFKDLCPIHIHAEPGAPVTSEHIFTADIVPSAVQSHQNSHPPTIPYLPFPPPNHHSAQVVTHSTTTRHPSIQTAPHTHPNTSKQQSSWALSKAESGAQPPILSAAAASAVEEEAVDADQASPNPIHMTTTNPRCP
jgi:hypothetical protein